MRHVAAVSIPTELACVKIRTPAPITAVTNQTLIGAFSHRLTPLTQCTSVSIFIALSLASAQGSGVDADVRSCRGPPLPGALSTLEAPSHVSTQDEALVPRRSRRLVASRPGSPRPSRERKNSEGGRNLPHSTDGKGSVKGSPTTPYYTR